MRSLAVRARFTNLNADAAVDYTEKGGNAADANMGARPAYTTTVASVKLVLDVFIHYLAEQEQDQDDTNVRTCVLGLIRVDRYVATQTKGNHRDQIRDDR